MSVMLNGYIGYDAIRYVEKLPNNCKDDLKIPDVKLIRPRKILIHDNLKKKFIIFLLILIKINQKTIKKFYII